MALVVLREQQALHRLRFRIDPAQGLHQRRLLKQLVADPYRHGHGEGSEAARRHGEIGLQKPFEFHEGLLVEADVIHITQTQTGDVEDGADGVPGEGMIVLDAGQPFLLHRRHDLSVLHQGGTGIVIEGGNAENPHACRSPPQKMV